MSISDWVQEIIRSIEWNTKTSPDENFDETPNRVEKWMETNLSNQSTALKNSQELAKKHFPTTNDQMLVQGPIRCYSLCPHHLLPVQYDIYIGILLRDKALGLSKYSRVCEELCKYPWLQEDLTDNIVKIFSKTLHCKGIMVMVEGIHFCMKMRGVKQQNPVTVTSSIDGLFKEPLRDQDPKSEFLSIVDQLKIANHNR